MKVSIFLTKIHRKMHLSRAALGYRCSWFGSRRTACFIFEMNITEKLNLFNFHSLLKIFSKEIFKLFKNSSDPFLNG